MKKQDGVLYATVAQAAYTNSCNHPDFRITAKFENKGTDSQGLFGEAYKRVYVMGFRGSEETGAADWLTDLKFIQKDYPFVPAGSKGIAVHYGFIEAYSSIRDATLKYAKETTFKEIVTTGHSLGGALATLAALDIVLNVPGKQVSCYTFGSPKVGNAAFAALYSKNVPDTYRIVNDADIIPTIPPGSFEHVGKLLHLHRPDDTSGIIDALKEKVEDHLPHNYIKALQAL